MCQYLHNLVFFFQLLLLLVFNATLCSVLYFFLSTVLTEKKRESYREEVSLEDRKFSFCPHAVTPSPSAAAFFFKEKCCCAACHIGTL